METSAEVLRLGVVGESVSRWFELLVAANLLLVGGTERLAVDLIIPTIEGAHKDVKEMVNRGARVSVSPSKSVRGNLEEQEHNNATAKRQ